MKRRAFVAGGGITLASTLAGCLSDDQNQNGENDAGTPNDEDDDGNDRDRNLEDARYTLTLEDAPLEDEHTPVRLVVDLEEPTITPEAPAVFTAELTNTGSEPVAISSGAPSPFGVVWATPDDAGKTITLWRDEYEDDSHVHPDGRHVAGVDDIGLETDLEGGESLTSTFELYEDTPGLEPGTYEAEISCGISPADGDHGSLAVSARFDVDRPDGEPEPSTDVVEETPRTDTPPHEIELPEEPEDDGDWNDGYLGEHMSAQPSLAFEHLEDVHLTASLDGVDGPDEYRVRLLRNETERDEVIDLSRSSETARERLSDVDFETWLVLVVESGYGSSSVQHRWARVEETNDGLHAHGYYSAPHIQTSDVAARHSVLAVERPESIDLARVSLTVNEETRVNFNSSEGVVSLESR